jgi:hypothetical protein
MFPNKDEGCSVMPYFLFNGMMSLALRFIEPEDEDLLQYDTFLLNVFEPDIEQPFSGVTDSMLQIIINSSKREADHVVDRYFVLKQKVLRILHRIINAPEKVSQPHSS